MSGNELYRDTAFDGGLIDIEFGALYVGLTGSVNRGQSGGREPAATRSTPSRSSCSTRADLASFDAPLLLNTTFGR